MKKLIFLILLLTCGFSKAQETSDSLAYKKRVLENTEVDFLASYYTQDGNNAAVSGGIGTEELTDGTSTIVVSIPLNADDVLTVDAGISAYTSASSSNVNPFDGGKDANPFQASSGASSSDLWTNLMGSYSHSSDDRNRIWALHGSMSTEYDYFSLGFGGSYTMLFNEKNTELTVKANAYFDSWKRLYPYELRPFLSGGQGLSASLFNTHTITGNADYQPLFSELTEKKRNSYSAGLALSQVFTKNMQGSLLLDVVQQQGLLSTPFQRVYFADVADSYIDEFQLADDIERLPDSRFKIAVGGRLNYYLNEIVVLRGFYRYYTDNWGITSHTASLEVPIKIGSKFTLYPSYRYYNQTAADYFAPYETHLSTESYYTSDYDLSTFNASQYGFGLTYTDIFTGFRLWKLGLKSIDLRYNYYERNTGLTANIILFGVKFVAD
ncbi:Protein of unknown function [Pustulibacterium marinum]|uniref:DUF3570 domain-containing protein n=1 Tax=Pustulibacterium marinum TaxID=1224947 RepID=A0A1I7I1L8_9FLAO|nr:DUF3570 domain-containing protein [Pustulibacterium marinum]SFU66852.1 Protein of unknown function [Pustulibacterium marinum]